MINTRSHPHVRPHAHARPGVALAAALALLALLGLMVAGALATSVVAQRAQRMSTADGALLAAADFAVGEVLASPTSYGVADLPFGVAQSFPIASPAAPWVVTRVTITRLPHARYWLGAEARREDGDLARRRVQLLTQALLAGPVPIAPLVSRTSATIAADVTMTADSSGDPDCAALATTQPVETSDAATLFERAGQLDALATAPGVVHVVGDTMLAGSGSYEGILIADGRVSVDGPFTFTGLLLARGGVRVRNGARITGSIVSQATGPDPPIDAAQATVRHAPCVVAATLRRVAPIRAIRERGWFEVF